MTLVNGIDLSKLAGHEVKTTIVPPTVPGRIVQIDADFLAYQVAYDNSKTIDQMCHNAEKAAEKLRLMSGAEHMVLHLTPKGSNKGERYDIALLKEYQGNRKGKPKPKYLHLIRNHMHDHMKAIDHINCEADDGMAMAQYKAIADGNMELSIIASKDKDLSMVPGLALDWDTGEITSTTNKPFGWIDLYRDKSTPKIRGRGWKYFWAQMLTGDTADNISGLPKCHDLSYLPKGLPKACGPVLADQILKDVCTNKEAFELVKHLYKLHGEEEGFFNYRDNTPVDWFKAMISEMQLLWMRSAHDKNDVIVWLMEHGK